MLVVMQTDATQDDIDRVCGAIKEMGYQAVPMPGGQRTAIGLVGNDGRVDGSRISALPGRRGGHSRHEAVQAGLARMAAGEHDRAPSRPACSFGGTEVVDHRRSVLGGIGAADRDRRARRARGGCDRACAAARSSRAARRTRSRGWASRDSSCSRSRGARPACRSSPRRWTKRARTSSPSTPTASRSARATCRTIRCCKAVGRLDKPVLLKRGMAATINDLLLSAEYILAEGNDQVDAVRARRAQLRQRRAKPVRPDRDPDRAEAVAPADHRRSEPRHGTARQGDADGARGGRGRRGRHDRRGASEPGSRAVRRRAVVVPGSVREAG